MVKTDFLARTRIALGEDRMEFLANKKFCVVGCGGTGATFAEMLVRSGAQELALVDQDGVEAANLNRVFSYSAADADKGRSKVNALKKRLLGISSTVRIEKIEYNFLSSESIVTKDKDAQRARDAVASSDVVFIGADRNKARRAIEALCRERSDRMFLSCGVHVDSTGSGFECVWSPDTAEKDEWRNGYGDDNASYISIVVEATSVAFTMLMNRIAGGCHGVRSHYRRYDENFLLVENSVVYDSVEVPGAEDGAIQGKTIRVGFEYLPVDDGKEVSVE